MCFALYVGSNQALPVTEWDADSPGVWVQRLQENDGVIRTHFSKPVVQYVGSTAGCGCDFPYVPLQPGGKLPYGRPLDSPEDVAKNTTNRSQLVELLKALEDPTLEIYCVWDGDFEKEPLARETISLEKILDTEFHFKERGFCCVEL